MEYFLRSSCWAVHRSGGGGYGFLCYLCFNSAAVLSACSLPCIRADPEAEGVVHRTFGGLLRSDVTCRACGHTSTAFDPFLDLSLDLPPQLPSPQVLGLGCRFWGYQSVEPHTTLHALTPGWTRLLAKSSHKHSFCMEVLCC